MNMNAIPTRYAGVQFRSRLEAKWAAMFDLLGFTWEYEPIDLNGYIPDFVLPVGEQPLLVEVKPILNWPCPVFGCTKCNPGDAAHRDAHDAPFEKISTSGWTGDSMLVGAHPPRAQNFESGIGRFKCFQEKYPSTAVVRVCLKCLEAGKINRGIAPDACACQCGGCGTAATNVRLAPLWREAGNRVQWRAPNTSAPAALP